MKAMILAAGKGTRLRPLTDKQPKALVPFKGVPMIDGVIRKLADAGISDIIVNVHHFAEAIMDHLGDGRKYGVRIAFSDEREKLLDTGGGLKKAARFFGGEDFFVLHNVDVYTNLNFQSLIDFHKKNRPLGSLAVKERPTSRSFLFDEQGRLSGWRDEGRGKIRWSGKTEHYTALGNSCIQVLETRIFDLITEEGAFSLTDLYLKLAQDHEFLAYRHDQDFWYDLGRFDNFKDSGFRIQDSE